jgi:protoporphyrinogen/coproporphyrinogen III oxidase
MPAVVVVGGGISGLTIAYRLECSLPDVEVRVLEKQPSVGGTIHTFATDGFRVEAGPNGFLDNKSAAIDLCRELGLESKLLPASPMAARNRFLFLDGRLHLLPGGFWPFVRSDLLSWRAKIALMMERFRRRGPDVTDESVDSFARRRGGTEVAETLVDAFVTGIHAGDPRLLSVRAAFPRLAAFERDYGSVTRGLRAARRLSGTTGRASGQMWSFPDGLQTLTNAIRERLRTPPTTDVAVAGLVRSPAGWEVRAKDQRSRHADAIVLACPAYEQAELLSEVDHDLAGLVRGIAYTRVAVVALGFRAGDIPGRLDGFGYLSPQRARRDVLGVQWCSSIYPGQRAPGGMVLLRALLGGWNRPEVVDWDDDRLAAAVRAELRQSLRVEAGPVFRHIVRWPRAIPQYHVGHLDRVSRIDSLASAHPGLFLAGNSYRGIALPDCVEQAGIVSARVAAWLKESRISTKRIAEPPPESGSPFGP